MTKYTSSWVRMVPEVYSGKLYYGTSSLFIGQKSKIFLNKENITDLSPDKRAKTGVFLSFQSPLSLQGVTVFQLLRVALCGKTRRFRIKKEVIREAKKLKIRTDILERSLNEGSSGGERKKIEVLQAAVLKPKVAIFDEVDTGVDVDALKTISTFMKTFKKIERLSSSLIIHVF